MRGRGLLPNSIAISTSPRAARSTEVAGGEGRGGPSTAFFPPLSLSPRLARWVPPYWDQCPGSTRPAGSCWGARGSSQRGVSKGPEQQQGAAGQGGVPGSTRPPSRHKPSQQLWHRPLFLPKGRRIYQVLQSPGGYFWRGREGKEYLFLHKRSLGRTFFFPLLETRRASRLQKAGAGLTLAGFSFFCQTAKQHFASLEVPEERGSIS